MSVKAGHSPRRSKANPESERTFQMLYRVQYQGLKTYEPHEIVLIQCLW